MGTYSFQSVNTTTELPEQEESQNIVRIYADNDIKCNIVLDELSVPDVVNPENKETTKYVEGMEIPVIRINDYMVNQGDIVNFTVSCTDFLPKVELAIRVKGNTFTLKNTPKDGDLISIALRPKSDVYKTIRNDFVIKDVFTTGVGDKGISQQIISMSGELFIPGFDSNQSCFGFIGTSKDAFKDVAKRLSLGFAFNDEENTTDTQLWLCACQSIRDYLSNVLKHTWKDELSFFNAWIDNYYNLTFVEMNKTLLAQEKTMDLEAITSAVRDAVLHPNEGEELQENAAIGFKGLINNEFYRNTTSYISDWSIHNNSTNITFDLGTNIISETFKHNQNIYNSNENNVYSLDNEPVYDPEKKDKYIILRGRAYDDTAENEATLKTGQKRANYSFKDIYVSKPWAGIEYVMSDEDKENIEDTNNWSGNVHNEYNRSVYHNLINIKELDKLYITVKVNGLNTQILRGEKIPVILYLPDNTQAKMMNGNEEAAMYNMFYSGFYYVDGVKYMYEHPEDESQVVSGYKTEFTLKRREWPLPYIKTEDSEE